MGVARIHGNATVFVCVDVNECQQNNGGCDSKRKCINTAGVRTCGDCPSGWTNDGVTGCKGSSIGLVYFVLCLSAGICKALGC